MLHRGFLRQQDSPIGQDLLKTGSNTFELQPPNTQYSDESSTKWPQATAIVTLGEALVLGVVVIVADGVPVIDAEGLGVVDAEGETVADADADTDAVGVVEEDGELDVEIEIEADGVGLELGLGQHCIEPLQLKFGSGSRFPGHDELKHICPDTEEHFGSWQHFEVASLGQRKADFSVA